MKSKDGTTWRIPMATIYSDIEYSSNDVNHLKLSIVELQKTIVQWGASVRETGGVVRQWASTQMLGSVEFVYDGSGRSCLEWSFPVVLQRQIREHKNYYRTSLEIALRIKSHATLILYDLCCRYLTNPAHLTFAKPWREWIPILTGESDSFAASHLNHRGSIKGREKYAEWRYFNRDVVIKAVKELNDIQEIFWVETVLGKPSGSRSIEMLQFKVIKRDGYFRVEGIRPKNIVADEILGVIVQFGFTSKFASELIVENGGEICKKAADNVTARISDKTQPAVNSPAGFYLTELKRIVGEASQPHKVALPTKVMSSDDVLDSTTTVYRSALITRAREDWENMSPEFKDNSLKRFREWLEHKQSVFLKNFDQNGIERSTERNLFFQWLAQDIAGDSWNPDSKFLLAYIHNREVKSTATV